MFHVERNIMRKNIFIAKNNSSLYFPPSYNISYFNFFFLNISCFHILMQFLYLFMTTVKPIR